MRKVYIIILFIILQTSISGCGNPPLKASADMKPETKEVQAEDSKTAGEKSTSVRKEAVNESIEPEAEKDAGVITDTVVDVFREADVQSERVTQAIFNQRVTVLDAKENWVRIKVVDGYTGWVKSKYVEKDTWSVDYKKYKYKVVITAKTKKIYSQVKGGGTLKEVVMGTELYAVNKADSWYHVALPGKSTGWVSESGSIQIPADGKIPKTTAVDFIATANKFKGSVYLWGGVSALGIDCSGLTYICSRLNGVDLPRDADQQYELGEKVGKDVKAMKPGDFVFFSSKEDLKGISHVGIYIGNNQFIHASSSKGSVTVGSMDDDYYRKRLAGVRRHFTDQ